MGLQLGSGLGFGVETSRLAEEVTESDRTALEVVRIRERETGCRRCPGASTPAVV